MALCQKMGYNLRLMRKSGLTLRSLALAICLWAIQTRLFAFSLVGPYTPWMSPELGYHKEGDMGGPMDIGEGYRWNVPLITYGFDQEFSEYFGDRGISAVEEAVA